MPFIPTPGVAQVNVRAEYLGIPVENVLHFFTGETPATPSVLVDLASNFAVSWSSNIMPFLSDQYIAKEVHVIDLTSSSGAVATDTTLAGSAGDLSGLALPGNIAFCVSLRTALRGRSFRGRIFYCGLVEPDVSGNDVAPARITTLVDGTNGIRTDMATAGFQQVIVSLVTGGVPRVEGEPTVVTTALAVRNIVSTQRRRLT